LATAGHRALLSSDKPLLVSACNGLCSTTPAPALAFRAQPKPTQSLRVAEMRRKYLKPVAPTASRKRAWAADMVRRADAGERVSSYGLRLALDGLGR
jgi:hypothetical protein